MESHGRDLRGMMPWPISHLRKVILVPLGQINQKGTRVVVGEQWKSNCCAPNEMLTVANALTLAVKERSEKVGEYFRNVVNRTW